MTEEEQRSADSPLQSDRGVTTVSTTVVTTIAGMSAQEVEGVYLGGSASRSAGGVMDSLTGSSGQARGMSVEVGSFETAIDVTMGIEYGKNILGTVGEVRQKVTERVQGMTGLKVTEMNVTISDIVFPEKSDASRTASGRGTSSGDRGSRLSERPSQIREREEPATPVEPRSRTHTEGSSGPVPEQEVRVEGTPVDEDETRRLRMEDDGVEDVSSRPDDAGPEEAPAAEAPADETTLTGGTSSGERAARETASSGESPDEDRTREIDRERVAEAEERRSRRRDEEG